MRILFLSRWFPYPTNNGSKLRIYNLLRGLAKYHDVTLLSFADQPNVNPDAPEIRKVCSDVHVVPWREFDPNSTRARVGFLSFTPRSIVDTFSPEMAGKITQLLHVHDYDLVIASQLSMAAYRPYFENIPALFEEVEIGLSYGEAHHSSDLKKRIRHAFTWFKFRMYVLRLLDSFQACTVVSEQEQRLLVRILSSNNRVEVVPNCVQVGEYENCQSALVPHRLIFSGSFRYHANYEAMLWFVGDVFPLILEQVPETHLVITGDHADLPLPFTQNVTLAGYVDDIQSLIASSCVSVAPLLSGGGTRLKILEAMAIGTPVVSTSKGAEGLDATVGEHLFVGNSPIIFAEHVVKILKNRDLRDQMAVSAHRFVKTKYNWDTTIPRFLQLVENISGYR
jgi:glycosyltransferase involved in cell wall biosynthesis